MGERTTLKLELLYEAKDGDVGDGWDGTIKLVNGTRAAGEPLTKEIVDLLRFSQNETLGRQIIAKVATWLKSQGTLGKLLGKVEMLGGKVMGCVG